MRNDKQNRNAFRAALAVFIAVVLWLYVVNVENPTGSARLRDLPIQIQGEEILEENGLMVTDLSQDTISIRVSGRKKTLMKVNRRNVTMTVDVSSVTSEGDWTLSCRVGYPANVNADSLSVSHWDDLKVTVTVQPRTSVQIPVRARFVGTEAEGYQVGTVSAEPSYVTLEGPEPTLSGISYALAELSQSMVFRAPVILMTGENVPAGDVSNVTCDPPNVEVTVPVSRVKEIPLEVELLPGGGATAEDVQLRIRPETVTVVAGQDAEALPEKISLGAIDLSEVFDQASYSLPIQLPEGMTGWNMPEYASVRLTVDELSSRQVPVSTGLIQWTGVPEGTSPRLVSEYLYIWVRGSSDVVDAMTAEDLSVTADLTGALTDGSLQRFPVQVSVLGDLSGTVGVVGTHYSIALRLE